MIDKNKIEETAGEWASEHPSPRPNVFEDKKEGFIHGARWVQQEFIKSLWHNVSKESEEIDWEQRRYEIAKECMPSIIEIWHRAILNNRLKGEDHEYDIHGGVTQSALEYADTLIEKLKKKSE